MVDRAALQQGIDETSYTSAAPIPWQPPTRQLLRYVVTDYDKTVLAPSASRFGLADTVIMAAYAILFLLALTLLLYAVIRTMENAKTFRPRKLSAYTRVTGMWTLLASGAQLLDYTGPTTDYQLDVPNAPGPAPMTVGRRLLFLHGSTESLDAYVDALEVLRRTGYHVFALEFGGYGMAKSTHWTNWLRPDARSWERDVIEAWEICGTDQSIVVGFSLGGGVLGAVYEQLCRPARPAQLVFVNTFVSFIELACCSVPEYCRSVLRNCMSTRWHTQPPCHYRNSVLIIVTDDDTTCPPYTGLPLADVFRSLYPVVKRLPDGGHIHSLLKHINLWLPSLSPPF